MAADPELQKRAREELNSVVGPDRLPTFDDFEFLPYIQAIFMECSRWLPVVPLSLPRRAITDDYYEGYFIPEGTIIMAVGYAPLSINAYLPPDKWTRTTTERLVSTSYHTY